jgi:hypothetical protein
VDGAGDELLAGAALAHDQAGRLGAGHLAHLQHEPPHALAAAQQVAQAVLGQQLDVHALAGPHTQGGAAHAQHGARREHGVVDAHGPHEGAVGRRVVAHHDALVAQLQLGVVARDGGVREHQPVALGAPDGQLVGLGDEGDTLVGAVHDAHLDGPDGEPRAPFVIEFDCSLFCHDTAR